MEAQKWNRIREVFNSALAVAPAQRAGFIEQACGDDAELRAEVKSLLAHHEETKETQGSPQPDVSQNPRLQGAQLSSGQRIGPYQVVREIGRGGMAVVYLAVRADEEYRKRVAIKVVRQGMNEEEVLQRFRNERQTLAALDHSNIVKLLDGGSMVQGIPYLVMEYVEGFPIDQYCDAQRLSITERLQLFCTVCDAVQYAHQNLVVHRDLKPSNILVTSNRIPKLLDFGIAKLLNPEFSAQTLVVTQPGAWMMTPEYASPEQIRGAPITTATDVYSLGVVLYRLLSGRRPYRLRTRTPLDFERAVCEQEPEKPSTAVSREQDIDPAEGTAEAISQTREGTPEKLRRRLNGDLDNIVLTALRKEPQRRYASVLQLSDDIRRHLKGLPVTARKATLGYRSSKFVGRNKTAVTAGALVFVALVAGLAIASWEAHVARRERAIAERRFDDLHQLADSYLFDFDNAIRDLRGSTPARALVVKTALQYLNRLSGESAGNRKLQEDLARAYEKVGDIQGGPYWSNLGDLKGALASWTKSQQLAQALVKLQPNNPRDIRLLARTYNKIGYAQLFTGKPHKGIRNLKEAIALLLPLETKARGSLDVQLDLIDDYATLGDAYGSDSVMNLDRPAVAREYFQRALSLSADAVARHPKDMLVRRRLAVAESKIGDTFLAQGDSQNAIEYQRKAVADFAAIAAADRNNARAKRELAVADQRLAAALAERGDLSGTLTLCRKALAIDEDLLAANPNDAEVKFDVAVDLRSISGTLASQGRLADAIRYFQRGVDLVSELAKQDPANAKRKIQLANGLISFGRLLNRAGRKKEARHETSRALSIQRALAEAPGTTRDELLAYVDYLLTCEPADLRNPAEALRFARKAAQENPHDPQVLDTLASAYYASGNARRAGAAEEEALAAVRAQPNGGTSISERQIESQLSKYRQTEHLKKRSGN